MGGPLVFALVELLLFPGNSVLFVGVTLVFVLVGLLLRNRPTELGCPFVCGALKVFSA